MEKDKVVVEKDSITRCGWCGTFYSPQWLQPGFGPKYCSIECMNAARSSKSETEIFLAKGFIILSFASMLFCATLLLIAPAHFSPLYFEILAYGLISSVCCLCGGVGTRISNKMSQQYLYRKDMYRDSHHVLIECEFCSHLNPPDVLDCQHCDASLRDATLVQGEIPEWFRQDETLSRNRKKCTHCGAIYRYDRPREDGTVVCQNCGKPFRISNAS
ncbi:MAG: hypothetical protein ACFFEW_14985, partial [Candidatus Thorarchaeota archaeon]